MEILYYGNMRRKKISEITFEFFFFLLWNAPLQAFMIRASQKITKEKFCNFLILAKDVNILNFLAETKSEHKMYNNTFYRNIQNKQLWDKGSLGTAIIIKYMIV